MNCPTCKKKMINLGNIDNRVYASNPPQWDETYVCHKCKVKRKERIHSVSSCLQYRLDDYRDVTNEKENSQ